MRRWNLTNRIATNISRKRTKMSQSELQYYFGNTQKELDGVPPSHIWNYDETNLCDDPGTRKYVMKRSTKYPEKVADSNKIAFSVMFLGTATDEILPLYIVYKATNLYNESVTGGPFSSRANDSKSGWFD